MVRDSTSDGAEAVSVEVVAVISLATGTASVADPLLEDGQKAVLTTYKNKLLQDSAGPKADDSAAWSNLRFMAIDNPSGFAKIDATDPQIANLLNANQFGHLVKIQNEIRSGDFDATPTPAQKTIQRLLHADSNLAVPDGASAQGSPVYRITQAGHEKLLDLFDRLSILSRYN